MTCCRHSAIAVQPDIQSAAADGSAAAVGPREAGGEERNAALDRWLRIPDMVAREVFRPQDEDNLLLNVFYTTAPKSTLTNTTSRSARNSAS